MLVTETTWLGSTLIILFFATKHGRSPPNILKFQKDICYFVACFPMSPSIILEHLLEPQMTGYNSKGAQLLFETVANHHLNV